MQGQIILCLAPDRWNDPWRGQQQVMSRLSRFNRILYLEGLPRATPHKLPDGKVGSLICWALCRILWRVSGAKRSRTP